MYTVSIFPPLSNTNFSLKKALPNFLTSCIEELELLSRVSLRGKEERRRREGEKRRRREEKRRRREKEEEGNDRAPKTHKL